ncbi:MAG: carbohydrate binding family 9 domain-containing protein [Chlorobi bacterium]|nr:carbohydrate binding family 9 domain-containing protein [Chlorobiota bacterium]
MKNSISVIVFLAIGIFFAESGFAQTSLPDKIAAFKINQSITLDGNLIEPAWRRATRISNFTQRELNEGQPATERTEVAILYDDENLYIGVWCYDDEPDKLVAEKMKRDFNYGTEDNFKFIIDTYNDKRNGYLFVTNPNGARFDALAQDNGKSQNSAWDGVWNVKTKITDQGWFAEFEIPFATLKFSVKDSLTWGINFERNIRRKREQVLWQGWSRNYDIRQVSRAGKLIGIKGVSEVTLVELKPYGIAGVEKREGEKSDFTSNIGGDINYLITPTMKLNLSVNTDFAQVESDQRQVNLTRFSLFYPEKREFFLEGQDYFNFGLGHSIRPFYSRRIGLAPDRSTVPIIVGARLLGKTGNTTLGGMSIQTAKQDSIPSTNYTVLRWKEDVFRQSSVGLIGVGKIEPGRQNAVYGADFLYSSSSVFGDNNLSIGGAIAQSYTSDNENKTGLAHRLFIDYPNDFIDFSAVWDRASANFNPETGFLRRRNYQMFNADLRIKPRPKFLPWIQKLVFKPFDFNYYIDDETHKLQSLWTEFRPLGFTTKSGEFFEANIQRRAENLTEDFEIHDGVIIPQGEYWFTRYELQFETFSGRPVSGALFYQWGDFYTGKRTEWALESVFQINKYVNIRASYSHNFIDLYQGTFVVNEFGGRIDLAISPDLFGSVFGQWNNDDNEVLLNFRINWIPEPGTNFYFVVNQGFDTLNSGWHSTNTTVLTKLVWRFVL